MEIFYVAPMVAMYNQANADHDPDGICPREAGWYFWMDNHPIGPYPTRKAALDMAL